MVKLVLDEIKPNTSLWEQIQKVKEEDGEFLMGVYSKDIENIIEEFYDSIQVKLSLMDKLGITKEQLEEGNEKHMIKILNRGWEVK